MPGETLTKRYIILLLGIGVISTCILAHQKMQSLNYHQVDYPYYMEFAAKLFDPQALKHYSQNPDGHTFFFMSGTEGERHFLQGIHFTPIKYVYALIYKIIPTPMALFIFISLVYFFPLFYFMRHTRLVSPSQRGFLLFIGVIYVFYPSVMHVISFDLRPYSLLAPLFMLTILSIFFAQPLWIRCCLLGLFFLTREEAIIFGIVVLLFNFFADFARGISPLRSTTVLSAIWGIWAGVIVCYYTWLDYPVIYSASLKTYNLHPMLERFWHLETWLVTAGVLVIAGFILKICLQRYHGLRPYLPLISYSLVFLPLGWQFVVMKGRVFQIGGFYIGLRLSSQNFLYTPRFTVYILAVLVFLIIAWERLTPLLPGQIKRVLGILALIFCCWCVLLSSYVYAKALQAHRKDGSETAFVWRIRSQLEPYQSQILCDHETLQVFYDYNHIYVYERLSTYLVKGKTRFHPANRSHLIALLNERVQYIVISQHSRTIIMALLKQTQPTWAYHRRKLVLSLAAKG